MKTARRIILVLVAMLCMQMSAAYASINYMADADLASKDLNNIMTIYYCMPEKDFLYNFSGVKEWNLSDKHYGRDKDWYSYYLTKGDARDMVSEKVTVQVCDGIVGCIMWNFSTTSEAAQKIIFGRMQGNIMSQFGEPYINDSRKSVWKFADTQLYLFHTQLGVHMMVGRPLSE